MSKIIPLILVLFVLGGGATLAFFAFTASDSYPTDGANADRGDRAGTDATGTPERVVDRATSRDDAEGSGESAGETAGDTVPEVNAAQLYETVIDRDLPLRERRAAAIKLAQHENGNEYVERIVRDDAFVRAGEGENDPAYMVDMNVLIALLMNIRYDASKPVLLALTDRLDDTRTTRMLRNDWEPEPPAPDEPEAPSNEGAAGDSTANTGGGSGADSGASGESGDAPPQRRGGGRTRMMGGVGGIIPSANSVELREYAMMALERALNARHRYNVDRWLTAIEEADDE